MGDIASVSEDGEIGLFAEEERPLGDFELEEAILRVGGSEISERAAIPLKAGIVPEGWMDIASELEIIETCRLLKPDLCGLRGLGIGDAGVGGDEGRPEPEVVDLDVFDRVGVLLI